jgi:hypothetical protein
MKLRTSNMLGNNWMPVAHTCNPSYSGGRDQEADWFEVSLANSSRDPISKKPITKKVLMEWLKL